MKHGGGNKKKQSNGSWIKKYIITSTKLYQKGKSYLEKIHVGETGAMWDMGL
jgi:hypothetical protein